MRKAAKLCWVAAVLAACGGSSDPNPAGTCQKAPIPTTGPGDVSNYYPATVGLSWTYGGSTSGIVNTTITGTQVVGAETAFVFTTTSTLDPTPTPELVAKRPAGVVVLTDAAADPLEQALYPELILPFPVAVAPQAEKLRCTSFPVGDLDGDGKTDVADIVESLTVLSITETATLLAGTFTGVADVRRDAQITVRTTASGSATVYLVRQDWYAPGVGRVSASATATIGGTPQTDAMSLTSWSGLLKPAPGATASRATASSRAPAAAGLAPSGPEAAALSIARRLARLGP